MEIYAMSARKRLLPALSYKRGLTQSNFLDQSDPVVKNE